MGYDVTVRQFMFKQVNGDKYVVQLENCDVLLLPGWRLFSHDRRFLQMQVCMALMILPLYLSRTVIQVIRSFSTCCVTRM